MASAITFSALTFTGTPSSDDVLGAKYAISLENKRRTLASPPITLLPIDTPANIKASYLTVLLDTISATHLAYITQSTSPTAVQEAFTQPQLDQIRTNLMTRLLGGESATSIVADTATL